MYNVIFILHIRGIQTVASTACLHNHQLINSLNFCLFSLVINLFIYYSFTPLVHFSFSSKRVHPFSIYDPRACASLYVGWILNIPEAQHDHQERTALSFAAQRGRLDCVRLLIDADANLETNVRGIDFCKHCRVEYT